MRSHSAHHLLSVLLLLTSLLCSRADAEDHVLLIGGLGGEYRYSIEFGRSLQTVRSLLTEKHGYKASQVHLLTESKIGDDTTAGTSSLVGIDQEFQRLASEISASDTLLLILLGHGQSDFVEPKFNLPGPDLTPARLKKWLDSIPTQDQRLILIFPCSGHFVEALGNPGRTILASTDGPRQIYRSSMHQYLIEALESTHADLNQNGEVTFLELFDFLSTKIEEHFKADDFIQTETPSLEDNGDGYLTTRQEGMDADDGEHADTIRLTPAPNTEFLGALPSDR